MNKHTEAEMIGALKQMEAVRVLSVVDAYTHECLALGSVSEFTGFRRRECYYDTGFLVGAWKGSLPITMPEVHTNFNSIIR